MLYEKELVSVIIPTYKRSDSIVRAINSVLSQTYEKIECIVVNDNERNDRYSEMLYKKIKPYIDADKIIFLEQQHHKNGAAARNFGILHASGEYIALLDDDDWWFEDKIEKQVELLKRQGNDCGAISTLAIYYSHNHIIRKTSAYSDGKIYREILGREYDIITCSLLIKRAALDETGYFDENLRRHQEIQLLGFLTKKYSLKLLPEYLTCVDVDDETNRPCADDLKRYKDDFFKSVTPILVSMKTSERRCTIYMHKVELINAYLKEKRYIQVLVETVKLLTCPQAAFRTSRRIRARIREKKVVGEKM